MKNKHIWIGIGIIIIILALVFAGRNRESTEKTIKIGNILFMTGPLAALGEQELNGMKLAEGHINAAGGVKGTPIEIVTRDYGGDSKQAVSAFELFKSEGFKFVLIDGGSAIGPVAPLVRQTDMLSMVPIGVTHSYFDDNPKTCRIALTTKDYGVGLSGFLAQKFTSPRVSFLVTANEYGKAIQAEVARAIIEHGGSIVLVETYDQASSDFRTQITRIKAEDARTDALVVINATNSVEPMFRQLKQLGFNKQIVADTFTVNNHSLKDVTLVDRVAFVDYPLSSNPVDTDSSQLADMKKEYFSKHGSYPSATAINAYDAVMVLAQAMDKAHELTPTSVSQYLTTSLGEYKGVSGTFSFNSDCETKREMVVREMVGGKLEVVK